MSGICIMLFTKRVLPLVSWFINDIDHDMCNSKPINVLKWYVGLNDLFTYLLQSKDDVDSFWKRDYTETLEKRKHFLNSWINWKQILWSCDTGCDLCVLKIQFLNTSTNLYTHPNLYNFLTNEYRIRDAILWVSPLMNCLDTFVIFQIHYYIFN